jgi:pyruvate,orthophosphate dikinase
LVGCQYLTINQAQRSMTIGEASLFEGDMLTLDGNEGHIYAGRLSVVNQPDTALFERLKMIRHGAKHD